MKKKTIGIAILIMVIISGLVFAADNCKYYSTKPGGTFGGGLSARLSVSDRTVSVSSSINESVKITSVKIGSDEFIWEVEGKKRLDAYGDTSLTIPGTKKLSGSLVVQAESCD